MTVTLSELLAVLDQCGSVFVVGGRGPEFWHRGIEAYPFGSDFGVLLIRTPADEYRYPRFIATPKAEDTYVLHNQVPGPLADAFADRWSFHLEGIVESSPVPIRLPEWAFAPGDRCAESGPPDVPNAR